MSDITERIAEIIRNVPDLTSHRFLDDDGCYSVKIHDANEVAKRAAVALAGEVELDFRLVEEYAIWLESKAVSVIDPYEQGRYYGKAEGIRLATEWLRDE